MIRHAAPAEIYVERVRCFLKWRAERFDTLDEPHEPIVDRVGWRRGDEYWIDPHIWREQIFDGDEADAIEAARALRDLDLLRPQDSRNFQIVANVRSKPTKVYAVSAEISDWRPVTTKNYDHYGAARPEQLDSAKTALVPLSPDAPPDLAAMLQQGTALALAKGVEILSCSADPSDRHYASLLRSQTAFAGHLLSAQLRVGEENLRQERHDMLPKYLEELREIKRKLEYLR